MFSHPSVMNLYNNTLTTTQSSVLWIFSPRHYTDQARRPFIYKFDGGFIDAAESAVAQNAHHHDGLKVELITQNPNYMRTILPLAQPDHILRMQGLSANWTFMLITMNDKQGENGLFHQLSDVQHLYYGYFVDEPLNPVMHSIDMTPNPNAALVVTHKTQINKNATAGAYGSMPRLDVISDQDVIHPTTQSMLVDVPTSLMRPEDLYGNIAAGRGDQVVTMDTARLDQMPGPQVIDSKLTMPRYNIHKILEAVSQTRESLVHKSYEGQYLLHIGREYFDGLLESNLHVPIREADHGLPVRHLITLGYVMQRYHPKIQPIVQNHQPHYDPIDQRRNMARNVFASMLSVVVPAIMTQLMIADITFYYNSYQNAFKIDPSAPLASLTVLPQAELHGRVKAFIFRITHEVMPILQMNHGEFDVTMHCTTGGTTHITLNFFDDAQATSEVFEIPSILGGFNNPLIGGVQSFHTNTMELSSLIKALSDTDRDIPTLGELEKNQFNTSLQRYDNPPPSHIIPSTKWQV